MPNACFRCKTTIESGGTFCSSCRDEVSVLDTSYTDISRGWLIVTILAVVQFGVAAASAVTIYLNNPDTGIATAIGVGIMVPIIVSPILAYALIRDAKHVRQRDDIEWDPSKGTYWLLAFVTLFVLTTPLVLWIHLRKRRATTGLPLRKSTS